MLGWIGLYSYRAGSYNPRKENPIEEGMEAGMKWCGCTWFSEMGGCQNYGPILGPYYNTGPNTGPNLGDPKRGPPRHGILLASTGKEPKFRDLGTAARSH